MKALFEFRPAAVRRVHYLMGGPFEILAEDRGREAARAAVRDAFDEIRRIEDLLSRFRGGSAVGLINRSEGKGPVRVPSEAASLLAVCRLYAQKTEGFFDPAMLPLTHLWEEEGRSGREPDRRAIRRAVSLSGYERFRVDPGHSSVLLGKGSGLDLGAAGKGYAVDRAAAVLRSHGIRRAVISTGSSALCLGDPDFGMPVRGALFFSGAAVHAGGRAVATSGNAERFFGSGRRGHILCRRSGRPAGSLFHSVTAAAPSALEADILATALFAAGPLRGRHILKRFPDAGALFISRAVRVPVFRAGRI